MAHYKMRYNQEEREIDIQTNNDREGRAVTRGAATVVLALIVRVIYVDTKKQQR